MTIFPYLVKAFPVGISRTPSLTNLADNHLAVLSAIFPVPLYAIIESLRNPPAVATLAILN